MQHICGEYLVIPFNLNYQIHGLRVTFLFLIFSQIFIYHIKGDYLVDKISILYNWPTYLVARFHLNTLISTYSIKTLIFGLNMY